MQICLLNDQNLIIIKLILYLLFSLLVLNVVVPKWRVCQCHAVYVGLPSVCQGTLVHVLKRIYLS